MEDDKREKKIDLYTTGTIYALKAVIKVIDNGEDDINTLRDKINKLIDKLLK